MLSENDRSFLLSAAHAGSQIAKYQLDQECKKIAEKSKQNICCDELINPPTEKFNFNCQLEVQKNPR